MQEQVITEAATEVATNQTEHNSQEAAKNVLFGTISYADDAAYENFIGKMNLNQAVFILIASANFAQAKGSFNILESETLATAIRTIRKNSTSPEQKTDENKNS